jgi:menaquinone-dependent protoporphyrinogen oxidase
MSDRILVAYATAAGSTGEVAEIIGQELSKENETDIVPAKDVTDLSRYRAVVIGSGIRAGKVYKDALAFLESHQDALSQMPVAYFVVCLTMQDDTEENRCEVENYVDQMRQKAPQVHPVSVGLFAGKLDYKTLALPMRLILRAMKAEEGDYRDWDKIEAWVDDLRSALVE